jgi:transcription antitermination factor NusG
MAETWFVAKVSGYRLAQEEAEARGFPTWVPLEDSRAVKRGRIIRIKRPLFGPAYIFVSLPLADDRWKVLCRARGFEAILPDNGRPAALPVGEVEAWRKREAAGEFTIADVEEALLGYAVGDMVDVRRGPFGGRIGEVRGSRGGRILILLALLGRRVVVPIEPSAIDPSHTDCGRYGR